MNKNLVIVESPAKAKTIGRYLGKEFQIAASVGHIRDLPAATLGVDVGNKYQPRYISMKGKEKIIRELKELADNASRVYIATDPDREGEAIAWHLTQVLKIDESSPNRITFNEITEQAVRHAVENPRPVDMNLVNSQQARRILDRLVGYELSPLLWKKIKKGLSAGRVQSAATRLIVDRENEIKAFKPEEYWLLTAFLAKLHGGKLFKAIYHGEMNKGKIEKIKLGSKDQTDALLAALRDQIYKVHQIKKGSRQKQPGPPFTTSTLQQEASRFLGFTSKKTMSIAQQLYEGVDMGHSGSVSLVTYIRTDSVRVSEQAEQEARKHILGHFGENYLPRSARRYKNRNSAQDAHEAIRPSHFDLAPDQLRSQLSNDQYRLYKMVWDRFITSQMAAAHIDTMTVDIAAGSHVFRVTGEVIKFPGFLAQYGQHLAEQEQDPGEDANPDHVEKLPDLSVEEILRLERLAPEQKFTQPPLRYTEATLIKTMEEKGIGRPSTYAPTISTILDRQYVEKDKKFLLPTELGKIVTAMLMDHFADIVDVAFTAEMEKKLDKVEAGTQNWISLLDEFYPPFHEKVTQAAVRVERIKVIDVPTGEKCPDCQQGDLVIKEGRFGKFIACSRYPECKYTRNTENTVKGKCPLCGSGIAVRTSRKFKGRQFYTCDRQGSDPHCPFISWDLPAEGHQCPVCGSYMVWKQFRGRKYMKCSNKDCSTNQRKSGSAPKVQKHPQTDQSDTDQPNELSAPAFV
jgi:DNA topoisomerase I